MVQPPNEGAPPSMPRWVKVFGIVVIVVIVLGVILRLVGGNHGPGRHLGFRPTDGQSARIGHELRTL